VRYFSPETEVPFCGHATIALGSALAAAHGDGVFTLQLNAATITVAGSRTGAVLQSPPTRSAPLSAAVAAETLALFGLSAADLDPRIAPARIHAGADHIALALASRARLANMRYEFAEGQRFMRALGLATIALIHAETDRLFNVRNPFASGGVYEDPATGAAAAALAGYLRDLGWPHGGVIDIVQGEDMGMRSCLRAEITDEPGASIRVSGTTRPIV